MKKSFIVFILLIIFLGCVRTSRLRYEGVVIDGAGQPIENALVSYSGNESGGCTRGGVGRIGSDSTDNKGRFEFTVHAQKNGNERFTVTSQNKSITFKDSILRSDRNIVIVLN